MAAESAHAKVPSSCAMCHDYHRGDGAPFAVNTRQARPDAAPDGSTAGHVAAREADGTAGAVRYVTDPPPDFG